MFPPYTEPRSTYRKMLKWTVSKRTETVDAMSVLLADHSTRTAARRSLGNTRQPMRSRDLREHRRKSLGSSEVARRYLKQNKENQIIATPHPLTMRHTGVSSTPFPPKVEFALRDVSNRTTPTSTFSPTTSTTPNRKRNLPLSPVITRIVPAVKPTLLPPIQPSYASTLPTFDIEYSPCGHKSAPMIALRGLTVPDSFFANPCYFRDDPQQQPASKRLKFSPEVTPLSKRLSELRFSKMSIKRSINLNNNIDEEDDVNMSSKALNDTELDKMIDEILESSRKINKNSAGRKLLISPAICRKRRASAESPTDKVQTMPDSTNNCDYLNLSPHRVVEAGDRTIILAEPMAFHEREVRTPDSGKIVDDTAVNRSGCHLRRQKGVRRKQQKIKLSDQISPADTSPDDMTLLNNSFFRKSIDILAGMNTPKDVRIESAETNSLKQRCITSVGSKSSYESTPGIETNDLQASSTPTGTQPTIRRCLTFSESPDSMEDSMDKRKSVASSTTSRCSKSSAAFISGSLDLAIQADENKIQIHGELLMV